MLGDLLLMIPGPVEVSPAVLKAAAAPPMSHVDPEFIECFGEALRGFRTLVGAASSAQPFVVPGSGTLAMEAAATNLIEPGDPVVVVNMGVFGARMAEICRRRGAVVTEVGCTLGASVDGTQLHKALDEARPVALFATHVDTSTGVRLDPQPIAAACRERGVLSVFDGVCATAAERFLMEAWGADVVLTASQKALGLPPGLALWVASERALERRTQLRVAPPLTLDQQSWRPVMQAYELGAGSYFATPPTTLVRALQASLSELLEEGAEAVVERHARVATALRGAWAALGLELVPATEKLAANTLSALRVPGVDAGALVGAVRERGVVIAGGLHPELRGRSIRVGHMGFVTTQPDRLRRTVTAVAEGLVAVGAAPTSVDGARALSLLDAIEP